MAKVSKREVAARKAAGYKLRSLRARRKKHTKASENYEGNSAQVIEIIETDPSDTNPVKVVYREPTPEEASLLAERRAAFDAGVERGRGDWVAEPRREETFEERVKRASAEMHDDFVNVLQARGEAERAEKRAKDEAVVRAHERPRVYEMYVDGYFDNKIGHAVEYADGLTRVTLTKLSIPLVSEFSTFRRAADHFHGNSPPIKFHALHYIN